jgi:hypothetical protein
LSSFLEQEQEASSFIGGFAFEAPVALFANGALLFGVEKLDAVPRVAILDNNCHRFSQLLVAQ